MKKILKITIIIFLVSSIPQISLNYIINEQIISRILFGVDYNTYVINYYRGISGLIRLISNEKMHYEWVFTLSKWIINVCCVIFLYLTIKRISKNNTINKKEFYIIMGIFSVLTLHGIILYIFIDSKIPKINFFVVPVIFITSAYIFIYKMLYQSSNIKKK